MHDSTKRLYEAVDSLSSGPLVTKADIARFLNESQQRIKNWETRGVPAAFAISMEERYRISARWLLSGDGSMNLPKIVRAKTTDSAEKLPLFTESIPVVTFHSGGSPTSEGTGNVPTVTEYSLDKSDFRPVYVIARTRGGMPERLWTDGGKLVGVTDQFAILATKDPRAFIVPVLDDSMFPRLMPGEYVLVQPGREPEIEDTVLVRFQSGDTMLRRLLSRRDNHVRLGAWNDTAVQSFRENEISWLYTVAHAVPAWMLNREAK